MYENISREKLNEYHKINHCIYVDGDKAYKNCLESRNQSVDLENNLICVAEEEPIDNMTYPSKLLYEDELLYGYQMNYLRGYITIDEYIKKCSNKRLTKEEKLNIIIELSKALKKLNKYYCISDINNKNIMINMNGQSSLIDWENGKRKCDLGLTVCKYDIYGLRNLVQEDAYKLFLSMLSLYYGKDLENALSDEEVSYIYESIRDKKIHPVFKKYAEDFAYESCVNSGRVIYLDDYVKVLEK